MDVANVDLQFVDYLIDICRSNDDGNSQSFKKSYTFSSSHPAASEDFKPRLIQVFTEYLEGLLSSSKF